MKKIILDPSYTTKIKGLKVDLYINSFCNFQCSYCATRSEFGNIPTISLSAAKFFIKCISLSKYDIVLCLLGGEPTLHKNLNEIIEYARLFPNIKEIELYTNGSTDLSKVKISYCRTIISIHPHKYSKFREKIIKNIKLLDPKKSLIKIMNEDSGFSKIMFDLDKIKRKYLISYITNNDNSFRKGEDNIHQNVILYNNKLISFYDYMKMFFKLPPTLFYKCKMDSISIDSEGNVRQYCCPDYSPDFSGNLFRDPFLIKKFKIKLLKCNRCNSIGCQELEIEKYICRY